MNNTFTWSKATAVCKGKQSQCGLLLHQIIVFNTVFLTGDVITYSSRAQGHMTRKHNALRGEMQMWTEEVPTPPENYF